MVRAIKTFGSFAVNDIDAATSFYRDTLGLKVSAEVQDGPIWLTDLTDRISSTEMPDGDVVMGLSSSLAPKRAMPHTCQRDPWPSGQRVACGPPHARSCGRLSGEPVDADGDRLVGGLEGPTVAAERSRDSAMTSGGISFRIMLKVPKRKPAPAAPPMPQITKSTQVRSGVAKR